MEFYRNSFEFVDMGLKEEKEGFKNSYKKMGVAAEKLQGAPM